MKNKTIVLLSIALAGFLLVIGTGIATSAFANGSKHPTSTPDLNEFIEREQQYQQLVNEANQKIELANQQINDLLEKKPEITPTDIQPYLFTGAQASQIAANHAGMHPNEYPELVDFNGTPAYEVIFNEGKYVGKVYIDANTGAILYNGLAQKESYITTEQAITIATKYLGGGTVTNVSFGIYDDAQVYIVLFSNGQSVYLSLKGEIKAIQMAPSANSSDEESHESEESDDD